MIMKEPTRNASLIFAGILALSSVPTAQATVYTATNNANWNTTSTWDPNGVPGTADTAIIPAGKTVSHSGTPAILGAVQVTGSLGLSSAVTFGDVQIDSGGVFNPTSSGVNIVFNGNVTNNGSMTIGSLGSATTYTYAGTDKVLAGNISNVVAIVNGSYVNVGTFVTGLKGTQNALKGTGTLTNVATLVLANGQNTTPTVSTLAANQAGNLVTWTDGNVTPTPKATAYYDLVVGHTGSAAWQLNGVGLSIAHNLTITNAAPVGTWPPDNSIPGTFTYASSSGTASTFPAAFAINTFNQRNGRLSVPVGGTLTISGTGAGTWARSGGTFTPATTGSVKFTGASPDIGGSIANGFTSLIIDSTATHATISSPLFVTNSLTIASGATLDVSAVNSGVHSMLGAESLFGSGTLNGSVTTVSGSKIYGGGDGTFGTCSLTGDLTMSTGSSINLDVDVSAATPYDQVSVGGALTLNNTQIRIKAPGVGVGIDTANDYTLVTAGSITGTPVLNWVTAPANTNGYSIVTSANSIKLHFGGVVTGAPMLNYSSSGGNLSLSWDSATYTGYVLQSQTNSDGFGANWQDVPGGGASPVSIPLDPVNPTVFFRLHKP